jgi:hypothetical protein
MSLSVCETDTPQIEFDKATFESQRTSWELMELSNYTFEVKTGRSSTGPLHARVTVIDGKVADVEDLGNYSDYHEDMTSFTGFFPTISNIYSQIASYYEDNSKTLKKGQFLRMDIRYNMKSSYPEYVSCGIFESNPPDGKDGLYYEIQEFTHPFQAVPEENK